MRRYGLFFLTVIAAFAAAMAHSESVLAAPSAQEWRDTDIGQPPVAGSSQKGDRSLRIIGSGTGTHQKGDQLHFTSMAHSGGDFEIIARLASLEGEIGATAGIMIRVDDQPQSPMVSFGFRRNREPNDLSEAKEQTADELRWFRRATPASDKAPAPVVEISGLLAQSRPIWLRLVRMGKNFAVYKSADGRFWVPISNVSGADFDHQGALQIGLFAASGKSDQPVTAEFDEISVGSPQVKWRSSWLGNTFGSRKDDGHVSNGLSAMWVAADGTCYTSAYWDEGGQPVKAYRDGKVSRPLPVGTPQTAEGGITGDSSHLYVASVDRVIQLDPAASDFAPRPIPLSVNLHDSKQNRSVVSGMASNGRELFVADSRDDLIRVATPDPVKTYHMATAANDRIATAPGPVEMPADNAMFAPAIVYQTQRVGEGIRYTLPGHSSGKRYIVRFHLAEFVTRPAGSDPRGHLSTIDGNQIHVAQEAGGVLKPLVKEFPYTANAKGDIVITYGSYGPGVCGIEVMNPNGTRRLAINCGGPSIGTFKGESQELIERAFRFERPGPMTVDKRGDLWIVQRATDFPMGVSPAKYPAAVRCFKDDGTFTGRQITDVVNPRALGYDAANDQLLVGENVPDLNVRIYGSLESEPTLASTFGEKGGIYAGKTPGLVVDPSAGDGARFAGISGLGMDSRGNIYVGGGFQGTDLRMFSPEGKLGWMLNSLMFCNTYDFDPASDGSEVYGTFNHLHLDLSRTEPGKEQTYVGFNWDVPAYGEPERVGNSQSIVRRLGPSGHLVMFTSGQGTVGDINIYRYEAEIAVPCGGTRDQGKMLWVDVDGNGRPDGDEMTRMESAIGWVTSVCVDSKGDLWAGVPTTGGSFMRHFFFKGCNDKGVPTYSGVKGDGYEDVRFPEEGDKTSAWGMACKADYDADRDVMIAFYPAVPRKGENDTSPAQYFIARYDGWSKGNRSSTWKFPAFNPSTHPQYFMAEVRPYPHAGYMGMQVAGEYLFMAYIYGEIHVFDLATGKLVEIISPGPEINGQCAWEDAAMGLRVVKRSDGEYLILTENSGWGGKNNFYRWKP